MEHSFFMDKSKTPTDEDLQAALGDTYNLWMEIRDRVMQVYPKGIEEWNFPGKKYGWSFRIKDNRRAILYLLPRDRAFPTAFVFGGRAFDAIQQSDSALKDIFSLIEFKLAY